ncbi:MAG TPA: thiamine pyrophosphate-binding protein [Polyangiaceae bacterium]|nr:thiamine pyrophosphate-binding protein [Polyangiaceae bacterium]
MNVAELIAECLIRLGVRHTFGVGGANIEDLFLAIQRRRPQLRAILCKHEHAAGTAADAYARLSGGLGVVLVTSGGGAMNLVHSVAEARASRVPLLALVGEPPSEQQGRGAFQDTSGRNGAVDAAAVFGALTPDCVRIREPRELFPWIERISSAPPSEWTGPRVLLLAKDIQRAELTPPDDWWQRRAPPRAAAGASDTELESLASVLDARPLVIIAGAEVARRGARAALARLAERADADVVVAPDARDAFENDHPRFAGVVGAMGQASALRVVARARSLLIVGTRLALLERLGIEGSLEGKPIVHLGSEAPYVPSQARLQSGASLTADLMGLSRRLAERRSASSGPGERDPANADPALEALPADSAALRSPAVLELLQKCWPDAATVLVDAGNTGASAVYHLHAPRAGRWLLAMGMAGMGYTYGAAIGAAFATGRRVFVVSGDGAFFMHGLETHTAVEHQLPITYLVLDNAAHGMCLVREKLLLGESSGYNGFRRSHLGAGLAAMFPGLPAFDCTSLEQLARALEHCGGSGGPCFVSAQLPEIEVPPFAAFAGARARGLLTLERDSAEGGVS